MLQQFVHDALLDAASDAQKLLVDASKYVARNLSLVVGHSKRKKSARLGSSSAHSATHEQRQSRTWAVCDSGDVPRTDTPRSSAPASSDTKNPREYSGQC